MPHLVLVVAPGRAWTGEEARQQRRRCDRDEREVYPSFVMP
jgi:hypothetical protein